MVGVLVVCVACYMCGLSSSMFGCGAAVLEVERAGGSLWVCVALVLRRYMRAWGSLLQRVCIARARLNKDNVGVARSSFTVGVPLQRAWGLLRACGDNGGSAAALLLHIIIVIVSGGHG